MNKMLVVVFNNQEDAFNGISALKDLHYDGSITLYSNVIISKDNKGIVTNLDGEGAGPIGTAVGMATGSLVGLLGGPVGILLGAYGGSLAGMIYDLKNANVDAEFVDEVSNTMVSGTTAIVADIDESWTVPIDTRMKENSGTVFRKSRLLVEDLQEEKDIRSIKKELNHLKKNIVDGSEEMKEALAEEIKTIKEKIVTHVDKAEEKQKKLDEEYKEKLEILNNQMESVDEEFKDNIQKNIDNLTAEHNLRMKKLSNAVDDAKAELR